MWNRQIRGATLEMRVACEDGISILHRQQAKHFRRIRRYHRSWGFWLTARYQRKRFKSIRFPYIFAPISAAC
jgi:hypothetical protein